MIVYLETKAAFQDDILTNRIEDKVQDALKAATGKSVSSSEIKSWRNSLRYMDSIVADEEIPKDAGIAIEFNIPNTGKRIDFILTGTGEDGQRTAVIIELKQWQKATATKKDAIVSTFLGGREREVSHPSYQAWSYAAFIEDYNETVRRDPIHLRPCAYLHNCESPSVILDSFYAEHISAAPAFLKNDALKLREFIKTHVKHGDKGETMYRIRDGKLRPSKSLADHLASLMQGNAEFTMIDDQKVVYETALEQAVLSSPQNKKVLIVNGGPGTGKTVVAINLLAKLTDLELVAQYVTKNSAPRAVYESKLTGTFTRTRISNLFVGSGGFSKTPENTFDTLIVDEAHRLNEKSGLYGNLGENQIKELIEASKCTIFFLDEDQRIHWKDIGEASQLREWAAHAGATVTELELESQFRCNGSDGYLAWVDDALQIRDTANPTLEGANYEFKVCDSATELRDLIYHRNEEANRARMVAGYCWDWISRPPKKKKKNAKKPKNPRKSKPWDPNAFDIEFPSENFRAKWNLEKDGSLWLVSPDSVSEVGCIHTCQGLELDYIGVLIGPDLIVRDGKVITDGAKRSKNDASIKGYKGMLKKEPEAARAKADLIIKNTYRTLMTRGMKGCYVYSTDPETNEYFQQRSAGAIPVNVAVSPTPSPEPAYPFPILTPEEAAHRPNTVPVFDLKIAAGEFSKEQWLQDCHYTELPDHFSAKPGFFVAQVVGESMNRRIPSGSWCLFREPSPGSREGKVVLVQSRDIQDPDIGGHYTVKRYESDKAATGDSWKHTRIWLKPESHDHSFKPISLESDAATDLVVVGEFVTTIC